MSVTTTVRDVLTLEEAAEYLRLSEETMEREVSRGQVPGRRIDQTWRFLKSALDDWLRGRDGRSLLLQQAGALADDETLPQLRADIYAARGRTEADDKAES